MVHSIRQHSWHRHHRRHIGTALNDSCESKAAPRERRPTATSDHFGLELQKVLPRWAEPLWANTLRENRSSKHASYASLISFSCHYPVSPDCLEQHCLGTLGENLDSHLLVETLVDLLPFYHHLDYLHYWVVPGHHTLKNLTRQSQLATGNLS